MIRLLALSTTALVAFTALPVAAQIVENGAGAVVDVTDADAIDVPGVAVTMNGDGAELNNDGFIASQTTDAVRASGVDFLLNNGLTGFILGDNRAVRIDGAGSTVFNDGIIEALRNDAVDANVDGFSLFNTGFIQTADDTGGRAIQARGDGTYVENSGVIEAWDETIEARENFTLFNSGEIRNNGSEDAVQFATGFVENSGDIIGGDDGIDFDAGEIRNSGLIQSLSSEPDAAGIDIDEIIENADGSTEPSLGAEVRIVNEGTISGFTGIGVDPAAESDVTVVNTGLIEGTGTNAAGRTTAMRFAPMQGEISVLLEGESEVVGDIVFGGSDDLLELAWIETGGDLLGGGVAFGGDGFDTLLGSDSMLTRDLRREGDVYTAFLMTVFGASASVSFSQFEFVEFGNAFFDEAALAAIAPVPLPAAGWLLLAGVGGLVALRRRA